MPDGCRSGARVWLLHAIRTPLPSARNEGMKYPPARWEASKHVSGYEEETAGDDGVRGEGAWALAPMHHLRSPHRTRPAHALQILPRPRTSAQRIQQRVPSSHRTPTEPPRLPVSGEQVQWNRIETSSRLEIRQSLCTIRLPSLTRRRLMRTYRDQKAFKLALQGLQRSAD